MFGTDDSELALTALNLLSTPVAVFTWNPGGAEPLRLLAGNEEFAAIFSADRSRSRQIRRLRQGISRVVAGMSPYGEPETIVVPDEDDSGYLRIILKVTLPASNNDQLRVVAELQRLSKDENDWEDLRSRLRQLQDLVDNSTALMYVKNPAGQYTIVNRYFASVFGHNVQKIVGKTDFDLFDASSARVYQDNDRGVLESETAQEAEEPFSQIGGVTDPDPNRRWLSIKFPIRDDSGVPYALGAISTDITARKRAESAAQEARMEAERANLSKSQFLSRMSHELRTPLNAVLGFAELLKNSNLEPLYEEHAGHILDAGKHLLTLVNDVLDISWIERGAPGISSDLVPASIPIHQAIEIVRPLASRKGIAIASDLHGCTSIGIFVDELRLRQVFFNLLGNAIKFNRPGGIIRIGTKATNDHLRYSITDTGFGIAEKDLGRLFRPFERLSNADGIEGSGLGLALSRGLVEEMGGTLGILHTAPGEGTTFYVDLPIADRDTSPVGSTDDLTPATSAEEEALLKRSTVVQVEDTLANRRLLEQVLERVGVGRILSATTGASGVALVREVRPDVVFLDLNLSDTSGTTVLAAMQQDAELHTIPVIILSADATPARMVELRNMGAFDYLTKPFESRKFRGALIRALQVNQ